MPESAHASSMAAKLSGGAPRNAEQIQRIISDVQDLVTEGVLNQGEAKALIATLNAAQLEAFVLQVEAFISAGILTPAEGQSLIDTAQCVSA